MLSQAQGTAQRMQPQVERFNSSHLQWVAVVVRATMRLALGVKRGDFLWDFSEQKGR
jgi:hypothetical protein